MTVERDDNEFWVQSHNHLESLIRQILEKRRVLGKLPNNLKQVWAFCFPVNGKGVLIRALP
jgi:hypothetical protein